ncbi:MAG TPA: macro domain-containing protein [Tepiditoga sp.]|nr:macro domain-containing protein [Thermotogota bacterium]HOO74871.1 macro domain-containing protein [Tepiditoga sp.]
MPFKIINTDITKVNTEVIVNAANRSLLGGGGVDGAIHNAAGYELLKECKNLGGCKTGEAKITKGYNLPAEYIIHTVGPVWQGGFSDEEDYLKKCYENSLNIFKSLKLKSIAFPLISAGIYGYPKDKAINIAVSVIKKFLESYDADIFLVIFDRNDFILNNPLFNDLDSYLIKNSVKIPVNNSGVCKIPGNYNINYSLYKKANTDKKFFIDIINNKEICDKNTAKAISIALELDVYNSENFLSECGFSLSDRSDIIFRYFTEKNFYDIFEINKFLFKYGEPLLGTTALKI